MIGKATIYAFMDGLIALKDGKMVMVTKKKFIQDIFELMNINVIQLRDPEELED